MSPVLLSSLVIAIAMEIGLPLAIAVWFKRKHGTSWRVWFLGALVFAVFQLLTRIPLISYLGTIWWAELADSVPLLVGWIGVAAISAGLAEEGGRWLAYRYLFPRSRVGYEWRTGVMFGLGEGGLESILLVGASTIASLATYVYVSQADVAELGDTLSQETLDSIRLVQQQFAALGGWEPLVGGAERIFSLIIQVCLSVIVLQSFVRGQRRWFWIAVGAHALVDFAVPLAARVGNLLVPELVLALFAGVAFWGVLRFRDEQGVTPAVAGGARPSARR